MEVTWLGMLLFPIGVLLLIFAPRSLYVITVFTIPFTATSLLNTASGVPLAPVHFFGLLFIISQVIALAAGRRLGTGLGRDRSLFLLFLFLGVVMLSMIMPLIINGDLWISSNQLNDLYYQQVQLTNNNIKNSFPVIFFVGLSMFWILKNNTPEKLRSTIKIYVLSSVFVSLWGIYQFVLSLVGIEYPYYIFNNAVIPSIQGYKQLVYINGMYLTRVSSVTHEASILSKYLLTVIPIIVVSVMMKQPLFSRRMDKFILSILIATLMLTTSSTAYIGITFVLGATLMLARWFRSARVGFQWGIMIVAFFITVYVAYYRIPIVQEVVNLMIFSKLESGSALERTLSIVNSWGYFLKYPILGVGWAIVTSHDLLVNLLVNTGLMGLTTFLILIFYVIRRSLRILSNRSKIDSGQYKDMLVLIAGLTISLITLIFTGLLTGLEFYLGYFYFIMSMLISSNIVFTQRHRMSVSVPRPGKPQLKESVGSNSPLLK